MAFYLGKGLREGGGGGLLFWFGTKIIDTRPPYLPFGKKARRPESSELSPSSHTYAKRELPVTLPFLLVELFQTTPRRQCQCGKDGRSAGPKNRNNARFA